MLYNVNGVHNTNDHPTKTRDLYALMHHNKTDLTILTETHLTNEHAHILPNAIRTNGKRKHKGILIIPHKKGITIRKIKEWKGRLLVVEVSGLQYGLQ